MIWHRYDKFECFWVPTKTGNIYVEKLIEENSPGLTAITTIDNTMLRIELDGIKLNPIYTVKP